MVPSLGAAIGLGLRALVREGWLLAAGVLVALVRRAVLFPAWAVGVALLLRSAESALAESPLRPASALAHAVLAPRFLALVAGLWLAGLALGTALRVGWLAGALPTLGGALAGREGEPRFAVGVAYGFPRVLAAAALGFVLDLSGGLFGLTLLLAVVRLTLRAAGTGASPLLAAAAALALTFALAVPLALSAVADAGVARAAVRQEGPARAFAGAAARFLARPGTFVLAAIAFAAAGAVAPTALRALGGAATGFALNGGPLLLAGPQLMIALAALTVAAALDLWWLGTVAALSCGE